MRSWKRPFAVLSAVGALVVLTAGCEWSAFRGGATRSGFNKENDAGSISVTNVGGVHQLWAKPIPGIGNDPAVVAFARARNQSPPVVAGKVYVNGVDGYLHALDQNGNQLWRVPTTGEHTATVPTPVVAGNQVFVAVGDLYGDYLIAYAADTGVRQWTRNLTEAVSVPASSPVVDGGSVLVANGTQVTQYRTDGVLVRNHTRASNRITAPVAIGDGVLYVGTSSGAVRAARISDGVEKWAFTCSTSDCNPVLGIAVTTDRVIVTREDGQMKALWTGANGRTGGNVAWTAVNPGGGAVHVKSAPAVAYGKVYAATRDGGVKAFDLATGGRVWMQADGEFPSGVSVVNGVLLTSNPLRAIDAATGAPLTRILRASDGLPEAYEGAVAQGNEPVVADHAIWQISTTGQLVKFGL